MPILYSVVARGSIVLAEFSVASGNAPVVARRILDKLRASSSLPPPAFVGGGSSSSSGGGLGLDTSESRMSYSQDRHIFHILRSGGLVFLCMANDAFGRRIPFAFLEEIRMRFLKTYGTTTQFALAYAMNDEFSRVLSQQMESFSTNPNVDTISRVRGEIAEVKNVMVENIDKVLDRGERIELLVDKTGALQGDAFRFKKSSRRLQQSLWLKNMKLTAALSATIFVVLYIIVSMACGGLTLAGCRS